MGLWLRWEFPFFLLKIGHRRGELSYLGSYIIQGSSKFCVYGLLGLYELCYYILQTSLMWRLIRLWVWIPLIRRMETFIRVHRKSLGTLILKWRN